MNSVPFPVLTSTFARIWCLARKFTSFRPRDFVVLGSNPAGNPIPLSETVSTYDPSSFVKRIPIVQGSFRSAWHEIASFGNAYLREFVTSSLTIRPAGVARARSSVTPFASTIVLMDCCELYRN